MRQREDEATALHGRPGQCVLQPVGERLVADHMDAAGENARTGGAVHVVRRHDRHHVDAVRPRRLPLRHFLEPGIAAVGLDMQFGRAGMRPRGIG